jgi:hypothetical protein
MKKDNLGSLNLEVFFTESHEVLNLGDLSPGFLFHTKYNLSKTIYFVNSR